MEAKWKLIERLDWGRFAAWQGNQNLPVYRWFYYKEAFSPQLIFEIVRSFGLAEGNVVLDPFCGVGTTLLACSEFGVESVGFDVSPVTVVTTLAKLQQAGNLGAEILERGKEIIKKPGYIKAADYSEYRIAKYFDRKTLCSVLACKKEIEQIEKPHTRIFLKMAMVRAALDASFAYKDGSVLKTGKRKRDFRRAFSHHIKTMLRESAAAERKAKAYAVSASAIGMPLKNNSIDAVITSPPYLRQEDYRKVYLIENFLLGGERQGFFGEGKEKTAAYFSDMRAVLREMHRVLKRGGKAAIVLSNAYMERVIECDFITAEMAEKEGFVVKAIYVLNKRHALVKRTKKVGMLRESMLFLEKG